MDDKNIHQEFEKNWWGDCASTYYEETKQFVYARLMGLSFEPDNSGPRIDLKGVSVLDIGGGPVSILLKTKNKGLSVVIDPCAYPEWIEYRYTECGITYIKNTGESIGDSEYWDKRIFDEVWIYNVLQHTIDPKKIIDNARHISRFIRIFEWIDTGTSLGHPHELKERTLNMWLGGVGKVTELNESGCFGRAYSGIFLGEKYE